MTQMVDITMQISKNLNLSPKGPLPPALPDCSSCTVQKFYAQICQIRPHQTTMWISSPSKIVDHMNIWLVMQSVSSFFWGMALSENTPTLSSARLAIFCWLVLSTPLKNISQLGLLFPIYGKTKNVPNHQPVWINNFRTHHIYPHQRGSPIRFFGAHQAPGSHSSISETRASRRSVNGSCSLTGVTGEMFF